MESLLSPRLPGLVMVRWLLFHNSLNGYQSMLSNSLVSEVAESRDPPHDGTSHLCKLSPSLSVLKIKGNILDKNISNGKIVQHSKLILMFTYLKFFRKEKEWDGYDD